MMGRIHIDQPVIHARSGLQNGYLNDDWFSRLDHVIQSAAKNSQKLWLYDEYNWPSGNRGWTITREEKYREHFLQFKIIKLPQNKTFDLGAAEKKYIAASAFFAGGQIQRIGLEAGEIVFSEDAELVLVYVDVDPYEKDGKYSVDYLSHEAIRQFIESTHEKYKVRFSKYFGNIVEGFFMDETRFCNAMPWTDALPAEFKKRKGYDIIPFLPLLNKRPMAPILFVMIILMLSPIFMRKTPSNRSMIGATRTALKQPAIFWVKKL
jgi:hypothetical protein